jgi:cytoskeleton protein RodZ
MTESTQMETPLDSPGVLLSNARQSKQLSKTDVAQKLCLKVNIIDALEKDEVLSTVSLTFTKGYIRSYAKLLGLDVESVIALFNELHASDTVQMPKKMQSFSRKVARENHDSRWMMVTYSLIAVVFILIIIWWVQNQSSDFFSTTSNLPSIENVSQTPAQTIETVEPEIPVATESFPTESLPTESSPTESPPTELTADETVTTQSILNDTTSSDTLSKEMDSNTLDAIPDFIPSSSPANIEQVLDVLENETPDVESELRLFEGDDVASDPADIVELLFSFEQDCWVKITDATGNDIAYGIKEAGRIMPVSGQPPFSVILGAPKAVKVQYAGKSVDLSFLSPDRTGRFVLPLQE